MRDRTHPCATSGFVRICWPNLSVLNRWLRAPPSLPPLPAAAAVLPPGRFDAGPSPCPGRVNVEDVAFGMVDVEDDKCGCTS